MSNNIIECEELVAGYVPGVNILNGCDLVVAAGEFVGIIGPNGAGKSTLMKAVLGLVTVTSGVVRLDGDEITGQPPHRLVQRGVGFVPQTNNVFPSLTVRENLEMGCFVNPKSFAARYEVVTGLFPRLGERLSQSAGSLSGGEQQMLAIGRGLMAEAKLLMLDEPSLGLSPLFVQYIFGIIDRLHQDGLTILLVEQNLNLTLRHAQRCYVLERGQVAVEGDADSVRDDPRTRSAYLGL